MGFLSKIQDRMNQKRLLKIKQMKADIAKDETDFLERVLVMSKEADINDLRKHIFNVHIGKHRLKCNQGLLNESLHEGRAYRLQVELKPDEMVRVRQNRKPELSLRMDENNLKYFIRGKIVTDPVRPRNRNYAVAVVDCGMKVHTRVGVSYRKGEWIEAIGTFYLSSEQLTKLSENTVLVKEIETGIRSDDGLHLIAVDSHKNLYLASDIAGNNEYMMFKLSFAGEPSTDINDDMIIPKGSYLANEDLRKAPREMLDAVGNFNSFAYDEEFIYICDGTSIIKVLKYNGKIEGIKTTNDLFFKDYVAEKFEVPKEMVK